MGSLFSALTTAVAGLNAQSSSIGNISDNLANAQTIGYKAVSTSFEELVTSSNAAVNNPGGVRARPQYQNDVQGSIVSSNTETFLAISGSGYFPVQSASTDATGTTNFNSQFLYTRQGDFSLDKSGYMVNSSGFYLTGYTVDSSGGVDTSSTTPIQVSALLDDPVATGTVTYSANLPSNAANGYSSSTSTVKIYDALGNTHDLSYAWSKTATNTWDLDISIPDASPAYTETLTFVFNDGTGGTTAGTIKSLTDGTTTVNTAGAPATYDVAVVFPGTASQTTTLNFGVIGGSGGVSQYADSSGAVSVTNFSQDGLPRGSFDSLGIDSDGLMSINYSNGTTRTIYQIPIVQFYAENKLQRVSGGAYSSTLAAGTPRYSVPGTTGAGTISANSLEQSNVDIATEFTTLIQAQQVYSANAKVVTADNNLLQVTINMVQ